MIGVKIEEIIFLVLPLIIVGVLLTCIRVDLVNLVAPLRCLNLAGGYLNTSRLVDYLLLGDEEDFSSDIDVIVLLKIVVLHHVRKNLANLLAFYRPRALVLYHVLQCILKDAFGGLNLLLWAS